MTPNDKAAPASGRHFPNRPCTFARRSVRRGDRSTPTRSPPLPRLLLNSRFVASSHLPSPVQACAEISQVRSSAVPARAPALRGVSLVARAARSLAPLALIHPASHPVPIRRPAGLATRFFQRSPERSAPCGSLRSLRSTSERTCTSKSMVMLGTQSKSGRLSPPALLYSRAE